MGDKDKTRQKVKIVSGGRGRTVLSVVLALALVIGALAIVFFSDRLNTDELKRIFTYISVVRSDSGQATEIPFEQHSSNCYAAYNNGLVVASTVGTDIYGKSGEILYSQQHEMNAPAIESSAEGVLVYDIGGTAVRVLNSRGPLLSVDCEYPIIDASINSQGYLAVTTQVSDYKALVTAYNKSMGQMYRWYSSSRYLTDSCVSGQGDYLAVLGVGQQNSRFENTVSVFSTASEEEYSACTIFDQMILDLYFVDDNTVCAVGETSVCFSDLEGLPVGEYDYSDMYLKDFSIGGDGFVTLALSRYKAGARGVVAAVARDGSLLGSAEIQDEILSVSADGDYVAVLMADSLQIYYGADMRLCAELSVDGDARKVIVNDDGTAFLVGIGTAQLYIP